MPHKKKIHLDITSSAMWHYFNRHLMIAKVRSLFGYLISIWTITKKKC